MYTLRIKRKKEIYPFVFEKTLVAQLRRPSQLCDSNFRKTKDRPLFFGCGLCGWCGCLLILSVILGYTCHYMIISLITAVVEFCILFYLLFLFKKHKNNKVLLASVMVLFLGLYQLSEYMLCNTAHSEMWARFGFAVYSFIPAIAFNFFLSYLVLYLYYI